LCFFFFCLLYFFSLISPARILYRPSPVTQMFPALGLLSLSRDFSHFLVGIPRRLFSLRGEAASSVPRFQQTLFDPFRRRRPAYEALLEPAFPRFRGTFLISVAACRTSSGFVGREPFFSPNICSPFPPVYYPLVFFPFAFYEQTAPF